MTDVLYAMDPFWVWVGLACLLLAIEALLVPTGFFLCLGTAAAVVAVLVFFAPGLSWLWTLTVYAVLMVLACLFWMKVMRGNRENGEEGSRLSRRSAQLVGERAVLEEGLKNGRGRVRIKDSPWPVEADEDYPAGTRVEVTQVRGITLRVKAVE